MDKLVSGELWKEIKRLAKKSKRRMAAVAYVTNDELVTFKEGDLLIVDASNQSIKSGQTSAPLLHKAFEHGAAIYSCPGLHAKVMLLDNVAVIGSANISRSSQQFLIEAAYITDHPSAVAMTRALIQQLQDISTSVDASFIKRINSIEVNRSAFRGFHGAKKQGVSVKVKTPRTWIVSLCG